MHLQPEFTNHLLTGCKEEKTSRLMWDSRSQHEAPFMVKNVNKMLMGLHMLLCTEKHHAVW